MRKYILVTISLVFGLCACSRPQAHPVLIAAGGNHTCALGGDGEVKCWGSNERGQLGNGTRTGSPSPVAVSALSDESMALAAGGQHTCALSAEGRVRCWGSNEKGQLGSSILTDSPLPVDVNGLTGGIVAVAAGDRFNCALNGDGRVRCWGSNEKGQLGNGTLIDSPMPVDVTGLGSGVTAIAAGAAHACALMETGVVKCWGENGFGQLGNKTKKDSSRPVDVSNLGSGSIQITAGAGQTCALAGTGAVMCWGWDGNEAENHYALQPESVSGLTGGVTAISAGAEHTCALTGDGVQCWGSNYVGQLGNEALAASSSPVRVSGLGSGMLAIAAGAYHTCVLSGSAGVECWGQNFQGELGNANRPYSATPVSVVGLKAATFASLTATAAPSSTPAPTPTRVPATLIPWPTPTTIVMLQPGQPVALVWLKMLDAASGWGIDAAGHILRTTDGGSTWRCVSPPKGAFDAQSFFPVDASRAWAADLPVSSGSEGCNRVTNCHLTASLWHTTDGGSTWQAAGTWQALKPLPRPGDGGAAAGHGLYFIDPATGWFLLEDWGAGTDILTVLARTSDGGKSLREIWRSVGIDRYTGVAFLNKQVGYLGLDNTTFFDRLSGLPALDDYVVGKQAPYLEKTSDGGRTWDSTFLPKLDPIPAGMQALFSSDAHMLCGVAKLGLIPPQGLAATVTCNITGGGAAFSYFYLSPDGGQTWRSWIATGNEVFVDPAVGWRLSVAAPGQPGELQQTANGGANWVTLETLPWQAASFDFINAQTGWALVTRAGMTMLARTGDGGHHWVELQPLVSVR